MIDIEEITFQSFIDQFDLSSIEEDTDKLISWTTEIEPVSLLSVFQSAKNKYDYRMFWSNYDRTFSYVGIGAAEKLIVKDEQDRYKIIENKWRKLISNAYIYNPYEVSGTGLVGIGGMDFDPLKKQTSLWKDFPSVQMTIPEVLIVETAGKYYLTINQKVSHSTNKGQLLSYVEQFKTNLLGEQIVQKTEHKIINKVEVDPNGWQEKVQLAIDHINQKAAKKIVMAREMMLTFDRQPNIAHLIQRLLISQPNGYVFAIEHGDSCFIGATPERLVEVHGKELLSACIAGTAPRGKTDLEDKKIGYELLNDEKNREEHDYVVQMIRKQITPYCDEVHIASEPVLHPLKNLQHLYTPVSAKLKMQVSIFEIIKQLHPTPALGGEPREESLAFIRENELLDRGWYGAPVGWLDSNDNGEFIVAIRSGLINDKSASLFAGCGVMGDSNPQMEYDETNVKFLPMLNVLEDNDELY